MENGKKVLYGLSDAFNHALEWRKNTNGMIKRYVCPALRATDYKCPKYVWYIVENDE